MNTLIIILLVALVAIQISQLKKITKLTREVEALRSERNTTINPPINKVDEVVMDESNAEAVEPVAEEHTVAMEVAEPTAVVVEKIEEPAPAVEKVAEVAAEVVAEPEKEETTTEVVAEPVIEEVKPAAKVEEPKAFKPKRERKEISSEDLLYWTILGVIAVLSIFFAIAL